MSEGPEVPTASYEGIDQLRISDRYLLRQEEYRSKRGLSEEDYWKSIIEHIESVTGPLVDWQRVFAIAAISGRGVEWAQTRGAPHYHIVGLPCSICSRS